MIHQLSDSGNARHAKGSGIAAILSLMLLGLFIASSPAQAKTIFDDDWTPPKSDKPVEPPAQPPAPPPPAPADSGKPETPAAPPPPQVVAPPARRPIPPAADQAKSRKLFKEYYAKELADHSVAGRKALVTKLLAQASAVSDAPSDEFVLLVGATQASREASDLGLLIGAADALEKAFDVDGLQVKSDAATQMSLRTDSPTQTAENCRNGMTLVDQLAAAEDFTAALKLLKSLQAAAPDAELRKEVQRRAKEIDDLKTEADRIAMFMAKLKTSPDDLMANYNVGQHLCFVKGDWSHGLPFLAKGGEPTTKNLATQELKAPSDVDGIVALADGWWAYADTHPNPEKTAIQSHAQDYYRRALPELKGLARLKVETRLPKTLAIDGAAGDVSAPPNNADKLGNAGLPGIDLLQLIDVTQDTVSGDFSLTPAGLAVQKGENPRLQIPYHVPEEYDLDIDFRYEGKEAAIVMILPLAEGPVQLEFRSDGTAFTNPSGTPLKGTPPFAQRGKTNSATVKVRRDVVQAYIGGQLVIELKRTGESIGMKKSWKLRSPDALGVGCYHSDASISKLTLVEISGHGSRVRTEGAGDKQPGDSAITGSPASIEEAKAVIQSVPPEFDPGSVGEWTEATRTAVNQALLQKLGGKEAEFTFVMKWVSVKFRVADSQPVMIGKISFRLSLHFDAVETKRFAAVHPGTTCVAGGEITSPRFEGTGVIVEMQHCKLVSTN